MHRVALTVVWFASFALACSIEDSPRNAATPTSSTAAPTPTSTIIADPADRKPSTASAAFVEIGTTAYALDAECHAAGVGEIIIIALTPGLIEPRVELYVQAFLGAPYVGISITTNGNTVLLEPELAIPFEIVQQDDVFRVDNLPLVTGLDLTTGDATNAGIGTIVVECATYVDGLPPGFGSG